MVEGEQVSDAVRRHMEYLDKISGGRIDTGAGPMVATVGLPVKSDSLDTRDVVTICKICQIALNRFTSTDGTEWVHGRSWETYDHEPEPVDIPRPQAPNATWICDFCGGGNVLWQYEGAHTNLAAGNLDHDYGTIWSGCDDCDPYIHAGDVEGLIRRVMRTSSVLREEGRSKEDREAVYEHLCDMHGAFIPTIFKRMRLIPYEARPLHIRDMPKMRDRLVRFWRERANEIYNLGQRRILLPAFAAGSDAVHTVLEFPSGTPVPDEIFDRFTEHIATGLEVADLYWISRDFTALALSSAHELPDVSLTREELPSKFGFIVYEQPIGEVERPQATAGIRALSWTLTPDNGIWVNAHIQPEDGSRIDSPETAREEMGFLVPTSLGGGLFFGDSYPPVDSDALRVVRALLATFFLMQQPGVVEETEHLPDRKVIKKLQRMRKPIPAVKIIDLRRRPHSPQERAETADGRKISVRFMVRGHWKRQVYGPKRGLRKSIYVLPFMKGPDGAPLKTNDAPIVRRLQ